MSQYTPEQIKTILDSHRKWMRGESGGTRANLSGADLSGANLSRANLYGANLSGADLSGANLYGANLYGADLSRADLSRADLSRANLYGANLYGADLSGADLSRANLSGADLSRADLSRANLSRANLSGANLYGANLSRADLSGANLYGANLSRADLSRANGLEDKYLKKQQIVPEVGPFTGFKKLQDNVVAQLEIIGLRVGGVCGRKCRTAEASVVGFFNTDETPILDRTEGRSLHSNEFVYRLGETVKPVGEFNPSMVEECAAGIHFFLSFQEAAEFSL